MSYNANDSEMEYRVVMIEPESRRVLVERTEPNSPIPKITIPSWTRHAEQVTKAIKARWDVSPVVLDFLHLGSIPVAVVEILSTGSATSELQPIGLDSIDSASLSEEERIFVRNVLSNNVANYGPFARLGWLSDAKKWLRESVSDHSIEFTGKDLQFNASSTFSLIRLDTKEGPRYWFKATGHPNEREFDITTTLTTHFPEALPPLVAARKDWNAWVMEDMGDPISGHLTLPWLTKATTTLASVQRGSTQHIEEFLAAGCADRRLPVLAEAIPSMMEYLAEAMSLQTSTKAPVIGMQRIQELGHVALRACEALAMSGIPDSIYHHDINFGNILVYKDRCLLIDCCEMSVGHPLLSLEYLRVQLANSDATRSFVPLITETYRTQWDEFGLSREQFDRAVANAQVVGILAYLYGDGTYLNNLKSPNNPRLRYSRSLARHLDRLALQSSPVGVA